MLQPIIIHQKDEHNGKVVHECWTLDRIGYRKGQALKSMGFEWISGPDGGAWSTKDPQAIAPFIAAGIEVRKIGDGHAASVAARKDTLIDTERKEITERIEQLWKMHRPEVEARLRQLNQVVNTNNPLDDLRSMILEAEFGRKKLIANNNN